MSCFFTCSDLCDGYVQAQDTTINDVVARTNYLYNQIEHSEDY